MKQKLFEIIQVPVCLPTDEFNFALFYKNEMGAKTAPRAPKKSYFDGRVPELNAGVNLGTPPV